jgi:hypothetical protein
MEEMGLEPAGEDEWEQGFDLVGVEDHVMVGDHVAVRRDNKARTRPAPPEALPKVILAAGYAPEKALEKLTHIPELVAWPAPTGVNALMLYRADVDHRRRDDGRNAGKAVRAQGRIRRPSGSCAWGGDRQDHCYKESDEAIHPQTALEWGATLGLI